MKLQSLLLLLFLSSTVILEGKAQTELYFNQEILDEPIEGNRKINVEMEELRRGHILYGERQLFNSNFANRYFQQIDIFQVISDNNFNIVSYEKKAKSTNFDKSFTFRGGYRHLLLNNSALLFTVELDFKINKKISFGFTGAYSSRMKSILINDGDNSSYFAYLKFTINDSWYIKTECGKVFNTMVWKWQPTLGIQSVWRLN